MEGWGCAGGVEGCGGRVRGVGRGGGVWEGGVWDSAGNETVGWHV